MHIDGDVLARVLKLRDGAKTLKAHVRELAERRDEVGLWLAAHLDEELGEIEELVALLPRLLENWL